MTDLTLDFTPQNTEPSWLLPIPDGLPYISATAISRVRDALPVPTECPFCSGEVKLVNNQEVYGRSVGLWPFAYACQDGCDAHVGVHADTNIPLGILANKELRTAKQCAKQSFHAMMIGCGMSRPAAYKWLSLAMGIPLPQTHYGWFTLPQVRQAHLLTEAKLNRNK